MPRMTLIKCTMTYPCLAAALLLLAAAAPSADASHFVECGRVGRCPAGEVGHLASDDAVHVIRCCSDADPTQPPYSFSGRWDILAPRKAATSGFVCPYTETPQWGLATEGVSNCPRGTYDQAAAVCAEVPGARLCTAYEALNDCLRGTGCGFDDDLVWTATAEADVVGGTVPPFDPDLDGGWTTVFVNDFDDGTWQDFAPGLGAANSGGATLNANRLRTFGLSPGSVRLVDNSGMDSSALLNLTAAAGGQASPYDVHRVRFWWHVRSFEVDEDFYVEYCPDDPAACEAGSASWVQLGRWEHCCTETETSTACTQQTACDFDNEDMGFYAVALPAGTGTGGARDPHLRFRSDSSGVGDLLYIDHVEIQGRGTGELAPSAGPSASPSASPTAEPSVTTSDGPSAVPTASPSGTPSASPSGTPTNSPSAEHSLGPSASPSGSPTSVPSAEHSLGPSASPSGSPTSGPSAEHSLGPSASPSSPPSSNPTLSHSPSSSPTSPPSPLPSIAPTSSYGWERVFFDDFDADWGHFFAGGEGGYVTRNTVASWLKYNWEDSPGALKLTARAQMSSSAVVDMTPFVDTVNGYDLVRVKFYWYTHSFENAEDYFVEYCADGLSCLTWEQLGQFERCCTELETSRQCNLQTKCDFNNGDSGFHQIDLPKPAPGSNPHLRIRMDASGTGDYLFIDNFELQVRGTGEHSPSASPSQSPTTDECNVNNGGCSQICSDLEGAAAERECECEDGFVLDADGVTCNNENECELGTHECEQRCFDLVPDPITTGLKYECGCNNGYRLVSDDPAENNCEDINECTESTHDCDQNAACLNEPIGSYTCQCNVGFIGDGKNCTDRDECQELAPCNNGGNCADLVNSYSCDCTGTGYTGETCDDQINECEDAEFPHQCHEQATCTDTIGSYNCTCNPGWEGSGFDCTDIDFCASFPCEHNGTCEEFSDGSSFNCICDGTGYGGDRCEIEIDECSDPDLNQCNQNCTNAIGGNPGYTCFCEPGYFLMDQFTCQDIDECADSNLNNCDNVNGECTNLPGGFSCSCKGGYTGNGVICTQLNTTSLDCPDAGQQVDVNLDNGGILTVTPSVAGMLCTLTEVQSDADGSEDKSVIPIARSYEGHQWESSAGDLATNIFKDVNGQPECLSDGSSCTVLLPALSDPATHRYSLTSYEYSPPRKDQIARALGRLTFGATPKDLSLHDKAEWDTDSELYLAQFIQDQMDEQQTPMSSHREYFRKRANPKLTHATRGGRPDHPCDPYSRWRRYSFIRHDRETLLRDSAKQLIIEYDADEVASLPVPILYEAEDAVMAGYKVDTKSAPKDNYYFGDAFANHDWGNTRESGYVEFTVNVNVTGDYEVAVRYSNSDRYSDRPIDLVVNNGTVATLACPFTLSSDFWRYTKLATVPLLEGENKVRVVATTEGSVDIDHLRVGRQPAVILKVYGHVRAVVPDGLAFFKNPQVAFDPETPYEFCDINVPTVNQPQGMIEIRDPSIGGCSDTDFDFDAMNPPVDFTDYEQYIPGVLFELPSNTDSSDWVAHIDDQATYHQVTDTDYLLVPGIIGTDDEEKCQSIPAIMKENDKPVFAKLPDGTYLVWTPQLIMEENSPGNNIADGGGEVQLVSDGQVRCSNVPRTLFNEDTCKLSIGDSACTQSDAAIEVDVLLNEDNIRALFPLQARYVYAIKGLVLGDPTTSFEESPCSDLTNDYTRWEKVGAACSVDTLLHPDTIAILTQMFESTSDTSNPYLVDVKRPSGGSCHPDDNQKLGISITVDGICYTQVHRNHLSVYDATDWAGKNKMEMERHPGYAINIKKWAECYHNPDTFEAKDKCTQGNRADFDGWSLTFPSNSNFAPQHPMNRWYDDASEYWVPVKVGNEGLGKGSRFGDVVNYRDLHAPLKSPDVANAVGGSDFAYAVAGGVITCGSVGEVSNDPTFGALFDTDNNFEETSGANEHQQQKSKVWTAINLFENDQLRQRMAWALSQILTIVPANIDGDSETEIFVNYYDIFVRNAFGNYRDILQEIAYSPLQAEHLTYLASKSHAYIFEDEDKRVSSADENFAREVSQLFTTGLVMLNQDGTPKLDTDGNTAAVYDNHDIMSFARAWTGFQRFTARGNIESHDNSNRLDPMYIVEAWRDRFPKTSLTDGYIGDGFPLCVDLPERMFLRKGAKYRLLGPNPLPELMKDNPDFANLDLSIKHFVLAPGPLHSALGQVGSEWKAVVVLDSNLLCTGAECNVDTVRVVKVEDGESDHVFYEYVAPACVQHAFYNDAKGVARYFRSEEGNMCANPQLPHASEACCDQYNSTTVIDATRNYLYDGERVTYASAEDRCDSLCMYKDMDGVKPKDRRHTGYHWLNTPCNLQVKINRDGYVAIVHDLDTVKPNRGAIPLHVSDESLNYFKVYWTDGYPSKAENNCGDCQVLSDRSCLCQTTVAEEAVFSSDDVVTAADIVSALRVGHMDPVIFDTSTFIREVETEFTAYVKTAGSYDADTVFKVNDEATGRNLFLRNVKSTVSLQGWSYEPDIFEAEDAKSMIDVEIKSKYNRWTGSGYGDFGATAEMFIEWEVSAPAAVDVNLKFRYANQYNNRPLEVLVNGESVKSLLDFPSTGAWDYWMNAAPVSTRLRAGNNLVRLQFASAWPTNNITLDHSIGNENDWTGNTQECQGDCDRDEDCAAGLYCYKRDHGLPHVPGCDGVPPSNTKDYCVSNEYLYTEGGPNIDHLLVEGIPTNHASYSFPNPVHFMGLLQDYNNDGIGETNRRDAEYETSAVLDHYFYHPNTAPFLCHRLMQRAGFSNPSPRYVATCSEAFRTGLYTTSGDIEFGDNHYGSLAAVVAAIHLDREATSPVLDMDPGFGALREPLLKPIGLMRALEYEHAPRENLAELWNIRNRIAQEPYEFPTVFSYFLPEFIPSSTPASVASHVSPESMLLDMPTSINMLNGLFSLVKYGLTDCTDSSGFSRYPGYGKCNDNGMYERASGVMEWLPQNTNVTDIIEQYATLLTAGRLSVENRQKIMEIVETELYNTECSQRTAYRQKDYRGYLNVSNAGNDCQKWTNSPRTPERYPEAGLGDHNYCRNPDSRSGGAYCYIANGGRNYCDVPTCGDEHSARRLALQAMLTTPEFHGTSPIKPAKNKARPVPEAAAPSGDDYKAIVYMFFGGGADTYNMMPPYPGACPADNDLYAKYKAIRGNVALTMEGPDGINGTADDLHQLPVTGHNCSAFGLHQNLGFLKELYDKGEAIFTANTGLLARPVDKSNYRTETPVQLFAHNAMQKESKQLDLEKEIRGTGIIGRIADSLNANGFSCGTYSIDGNQIALVGEPGVSPSPIILSKDGMKEFDPESSSSNLARLVDEKFGMPEVIRSLNSATTADSNFFAETWSLKVTEAMDQYAEIYTALENTYVPSGFPNTGLAEQLRLVTQLMQSRAERGKDRDIFYVEVGGWDTHSYVLDELVENFGNVNAALEAFVNEVTALGLWQSTTLMQFSEFARTLDPNSGPSGDGTGAGSDHGWGGHNFILGGSLKGGQVLGEYPDDFSEDGERALSRGRMVPKTPWDATFNGVAEWMGVPGPELNVTIPHRKNFLGENLLFDKDTLFK